MTRVRGAARQSQHRRVMKDYQSGSPLSFKGRQVESETEAIAHSLGEARHSRNRKKHRSR